MDRQHILDEIKRTAQTNGGKPLGKDRFLRETGIKQTDWYGIHWVRWGDALTEAGFAPNQMQSAYDDDYLLGKLAQLVRELGHFPVGGERRLKARSDPEFPCHSVFNRLGTKRQLASMVVQYCRERGDYDDVIGICASLGSQDEAPNIGTEQSTEPAWGFVYLMKSGRYYKVGKSNSPGRRQYELGILLPERLETVHAIQTDDPEGIEAYWHHRFKAKRKQGEWFDLNSEDVKAFRRRKFM